MEAIKQMAKSQIKNANNMLNKNLSREQISYYMGVKRVATDVLNFVEDHKKRRRGIRRNSKRTTFGYRKKTCANRPIPKTI